MDPSVWNQPVAFTCTQCRRPLNATLQAIVQWIRQHGPVCSGCGGRLQFPDIVGQAWNYLQQQQPAAGKPAPPAQPAAPPRPPQPAQPGVHDFASLQLADVPPSPAELEAQRREAEAQQAAAASSGGPDDGFTLDLAPIEEEEKPETLDYCPFCNEDVDPTQPRVVCGACFTNHHLSCWSEGGVKCCNCGFDEPAEVNP